MTNKHTSPNQPIIRFPSVSDPYVYLKTLSDSSPLQPLKYSAYLRASGMLDMVNKKLNSRKVITGSLNFLKQIAQQERANEIAFFEDKINKLKKFNGAHIQNLKNNLEIFKKNPSASNYIFFIRNLNEALQGVEKIEKRLQSFLNDYELKYSKTRKDLHTIALSQANTLLHSIQEQRTTTKDNLDELIRVFILKFMERQGTNTIASILAKKGSLATENFVAASIYLQQSIFKFLIDNPEIINYKKYEMIDLEKNIQELYPKFEEAFLQTTEASIFTRGGSQLENILNEVSDFFEIKTLEKQIRNKDGKTSAREKNSTSESLDKLLSLSGKSSKYLKDLLRKTQIKTKFSKTAFGNFKELDTLLSGIFVQGVQVGTIGGGTDSIYIGDFEISHETKFSEVELFEEQEKLLKDLKNSLKPNETSKNTELFKDLIIKLNELYKSIDDIKQGFIIHESTKFYQTIEKGKWYNNIPGFKGRNMQIFSYIDNIASLGTDFGIDTNWLKFAALNLSSPALGSHLIAPLEKYFTTFIGLIMFDDFELIAKDMTQMIPNNKIKTIHLYKLQDLYFPSSYFLEQTYNRMTMISDALDSANAFHIKIKTPGAGEINSKVQ